MDHAICGEASSNIGERGENLRTGLLGGFQHIITHILYYSTLSGHTSEDYSLIARIPAYHYTHSLLLNPLRPHK
jgi:hypothetical protein